MYVCMYMLVYKEREMLYLDTTDKVRSRLSTCAVV